MELPRITGFCEMRNKLSVFITYVHEICVGLTATNKDKFFCPQCDK